MTSIQSLTFLGVAFLISWTCVIGGYYGGFVEVPESLIILPLSMMGPALSALLCVWGLWHASAIFLYGLNYPEYPVMRTRIFILWCALLSRSLLSLAKKQAPYGRPGSFMVH